DCTTASARHSRGSRAGSPSTRCSTAFPTWRSLTTISSARPRRPSAGGRPCPSTSAEPTMSEQHEMRVLVTGVDADGRSCVVSEQVGLDPVPDGAFHFGAVHRPPSGPPPAGPAARTERMDVQVPPGIAQWVVVDYEPGGVQEWHHTDTVDFDLVLQGSIDLTLDDGVHH